MKSTRPPTHPPTHPPTFPSAGRIGRVHLETLASVPGVQPVILSDVVEPVLKEVTAQYGVPNYTLDGDEVGWVGGWLNALL